MEGKAPRARDFTGTWNTSAGSVVTKMMLTQIGDRVTGTYDFAGGTISGTAKGNVLRYRWTQTDGRKGAGYFELVDGGNGLRGHWSHTDDPDNKSGGSWTGTRLE